MIFCIVWKTKNEMEKFKTIFLQKFKNISSLFYSPFKVRLEIAENWHLFFVWQYKSPSQICYLMAMKLNFATFYRKFDGYISNCSHMKQSITKPDALRRNLIVTPTWFGHQRGYTKVTSFKKFTLWTLRKTSYTYSDV